MQVDLSKLRLIPNLEEKPLVFPDLNDKDVVIEVNRESVLVKAEHLEELGECLLELSKIFNISGSGK